MDFTCVIGVLEIDLLLPLCHALKDKRGILAKTTHHLRKKLSISVAEVAKHDLWGRAGLAAVTVSGDRTMVENCLREAVKLLQRDPDVQVVDYSVQLL